MPFALPFKQPYVTARGRLESREIALVRIVTEDGLVGLGEAGALMLRGGPELRLVMRDLAERCGPLLEGEEFDPDQWSALASRCDAAGSQPQALAGVEMALLDLAGKASGRPAWSVLGATGVGAVECNATLVAGEPEAVADNALEWADRGFSTFKLKVGMDGDVEQVLAVREALGPQAKLRLDANGAWTLQQAMDRLRQLEPLGIELVEQPVASVPELAAVRARVGMPVAADESVTGADDARVAVATRACDLATVKIAKVGGLTPARAISEVLPVYLSSALDGPVGIAAAAHLAQALPDVGLRPRPRHCGSVRGQHRLVTLRGR